MHWNAYGSRVNIEILHVANCPNLAAARRRVRQALETLGSTAAVREVEVSSAADAVRLGMNGSPTVLVDGRDPFAGPEPSVACRLYRDGTKVEGAPSVDALVEALMVEGPADGTGAQP